MRQGKLFIVGTGPGACEHMTGRALEAIRQSSIIVGFKTYIELINDLLVDKDVVLSSMTEEVKRTRYAIETALQGKTVALVSGGDPGIYALAGLALELLSTTYETYADAIDVEVVTGVPALAACAAALGAPLMHDFASISLSDRLTPWELIEKRLHAASQADFVICIYNPKSKGRAEHLSKALEIIGNYRSPDTPAGIVKSATRGDESVLITTLKTLPSETVDMHSTVFIGNSMTYTYGRWMITPRGYKITGRASSGGDISSNNTDNNNTGSTSGSGSTK